MQKKQRKRIAFDLDETLGAAIVNSSEVEGFSLRYGVCDLLEELSVGNDLVLWTVSTRRYLEKCLLGNLLNYFTETYTWDEFAENWKDVRKLQVDFLIDDSIYHKERAEEYGVGSCYVIIPAYGSCEDLEDPTVWVSIVKNIVCS